MSRLLACGRSALLIGLYLLLAACGAIPQPFRPAESGLDVTTRAAAPGVTVLPVRGLTPPLNEVTATRIAAALIEQGVLAEAMPFNAGLGFTLTGYVNGTTALGPEQEIDITWEFRQRKAGVIDRLETVSRVPAEAWLVQDLRIADVLAASPVELLTSYLAPQAAPQTPAPEPEGLRVAVLPVIGAPEEGKAALARTLRTQLALSGYRRADGAADVVIATEWKSEPSGPNQTYIDITWTLTDGATGATLGQQGLDNTIPNEALEGLWGPLSLAIVSAGLPGLQEIIDSRTP